MIRNCRTIYVLEEGRELMEEEKEGNVYNEEQVPKKKSGI